MLTPIQTHKTAWDPGLVAATLNLSLDACFVPLSTGGVRLDSAHVVVLDNFISESERSDLLEYITHPGWDHEQGPPTDKWEKATRDAADYPRTWGLKGAVLQELGCSQLRAKVEVQSRLAKLYPEVTICHQPSDAIQRRASKGTRTDNGSPHQAPPEAHHTQPSEDVKRSGSMAGKPLPVESVEHVHRSGVGQPEEAGSMGRCGVSGKGDGSEGGGGGLPGCGGGGSVCGEQAGCGVSGRRDGSECGRSVGGGGEQAGCGGGGNVCGEGRGSAAHAVRCSCDMGDGGACAGVTQLEGRDAAGGSESEELSEEEGEEDFDCSSILANAAVHGDKFGWHQDADPTTFPPSAFTDAFGNYPNREPGKPLFVSLILYLNASWPKEWDAETLFLDAPSDTGIVVRPKPYRAVLMDQDVQHRLSQPSHHARGCPRYSLVWKLVMVPKSHGQECSISKPELWGPPTAFGSSAKADAVVRQMARKRKAEAEPAK